MKFEQAELLYEQYTREAHQTYRRAMDASNAQLQQDFKDAEQRYPNWGPQYETLLENANTRFNQRNKEIGRSWAKAKREAIDRLRPSAPADFIEAMS